MGLGLRDKGRNESEWRKMAAATSWAFQSVFCFLIRGGSTFNFTTGGGGRGSG